MPLALPSSPAPSPPPRLPAGVPAAGPPDPAAAVLGALVTGALTLADVAELDDAAIPGEALPVLREILSAQAAAGRRTQGVRLGDVRAALATLGAPEDVAERIVGYARAAPKRKAALVALGAVREAFAGRAEPEPVEEPEAIELPDLPAMGDPRRPIAELGAPCHGVALDFERGDARLRAIMAGAQAAWERAEPRWSERDRSPGMGRPEARERMRGEAVAAIAGRG